MKSFRVHIATSASALSLLSMPVLWASAVAQEVASIELNIAQPDDPVELSEDVLVVQGVRQAGAVIGDIEPEVSLTEADIQAYGVSTIEELLALLEPLTSSGRGRGGGRPVFLLNGARIGNFREIRRYPAEALQRVDILPEDVAVKYGYRADQRVVNFVLKPGFKSLSLEVEYGEPEHGEKNYNEYEAGWLQIGDMRRTSIDGEIETSTSLFESDRDILSSDLSAPFAVLGNVTGVPLGSEIDPALSTLLGTVTAAAGLPGTTGTLALDDLSATVNETDERPFRTVSPATEETSLSITHSRTTENGVVMTFNAAADHSESDAVLGLVDTTLIVPSSNPFSPFANDVAVYQYLDPSNVLTRNSESLDANLSATFDGGFSGWRYNVIADYSVTDSTTRTDREADITDVQTAVTNGDVLVNPFAPLSSDFSLSRDRSTSVLDELSLDATLNGSLKDTDVGSITTTLRGRISTVGLETEDDVSGTLLTSDLSRDSYILRGTVDVPLASRDDGIGPNIGDLSFDIRGEVDDLSDVGTLTTYGAGVRWSPVEKLRLTASWRTEDGAPSITQLGASIIDTPNVRIFDFTTGETVEITRRSGGNADLIDDTREVLGVGARWEISDSPRMDITTDYTDERIENPISSFPQLTPEIEAAFTDRVTRDIDTGELLFVDGRSINYDSQTRRELRTAFNFRKRLSAAGSGRPSGAPGGERRGPPSGERPGAGEAGQSQGAGRGDGQGQSQAQGQRSGAGGPPSGGGQRGGGRARIPGGGFGGSGGGVIFGSVTHTWTLEDEILIRDGVPVLDLLDGSAAGNFGGQPEHEISGRLFSVYNGIGGGINFEWQSGTRVDGDTAADALEFSDLMQVDARLFVNFDRRRGTKNKWLKGTRLRLSVQNIFDEQLDVRDASGAVPITYQPDLIDPIGRRWEISFRKLFY